MKGMLAGAGLTQTLVALPGNAGFDAEVNVAVKYASTDRIQINERKWRGTSICVIRTANYGTQRMLRLDSSRLGRRLALVVPGFLPDINCHSINKAII